MDKIQTFKNTFYSIETYLKLLEEQVDYRTNFYDYNDTCFYMITQFTKNREKIQYLIEYSKIIEAVELRIVVPSRLFTKVMNNFSKSIQPSSNVNVEELVHHMGISCYFNFEQISNLNGVANLLVLNK